MPVQDLFATTIKQDKLQDEKAIVCAVARYFETAASEVKSPERTAETSIISALHKYFAAR